MYRLLIVDDEPTVRKGMLKCIDWRKNGIEIIDEADNGAAAMEKALSFRPHILLTDIKMPVMDGIELSHQVRENLPDCKIVIMSGYDEFAYAKSLMRMKVTEYLLKPIDENELMLVISRLITELNEEEAHRSSQQAASLLLHESLPQLKLKFISKILDGDFSDISELAKQASVLNLRVPTNECVYMAVAIAVESQNITSGEECAAKTEVCLSVAAEEIINQTAAGFICLVDSNNLAGIICADPKSSPDTDSLCYDICRAINGRSGNAAFVSVGSAVQSVSDIKNSYVKALSDLDEKRHKGKRGFVQIALRYMDKNYDKDIGLSDVAEIAFVTPNYLSRVFKEEMNMSFIDYLNQLRVEKAKHFLLHTNLKTYEIAEKVGYKDYKYFSAMLKKLTGFSPKEYRKNT